MFYRSDFDTNGALRTLPRALRHPEPDPARAMAVLAEPVHEGYLFIP
jgi:hypothetical protein